MTKWIKFNQLSAGKSTLNDRKSLEEQEVCVASALLHDPLDSERIYAMDKLLLAICVLELLISTCSYLLIVSSMLRKVRSHIELYDRIDALDRELMRDFGANLNYHKLLLKNLIEMIALLLTYWTAVYRTVAYAAPTRKAYAYAAAMFYLACTFGPHSICFLHSNLAQIIYVRFRLIQKLLDANYLRTHFPQPQLCAARLQNLVDMVLAFHNVIDSINGVYRTSLMVGLTHDFTLASTALYLLFGHSLGGSIDSQLFVCIAIWLLLPLHKIFSAPVHCDSTIEEGKRCLRLIEQIDVWFPNFKSVKLIVNTTMHWRLENKIEFACGLNMIYNRAIIATITTVIFNYLLILIQFRMTQIMGEQIEEQKNILHGWIYD
ncbi:putative gustatory receptor 57a [Rhagoletis pomonella]|uniref:putative gustatory receptor 57a n=1 Tax=Rhagoletis pomonella TaxID=28610 RepID=UPI001780D582|nr:putative gustatory receptor 57a [Rhagoletis pomonella]